MQCKNYLASGLLIALIIMSNHSVSQNRVLYRYVNEKGVKVLTYNVPAQYISNGYEIIDSNGRLIEIVPPELSPEEKMKAELRQAEIERMKSWDQQLLKRYSRVSDIEAAKNRKLAEILSNINILQSNAVNLNNEIDELQSKAAAMERRGEAVSDAILDSINIIKEELEATANRIELRQKEYHTQTERFEKDIARFRIIKPENVSIIEEENNRDIDK